MTSEQVNRRKDFEWALGLNRRSLDLMGVWPSENQQTEKFARCIRIPLMFSSIILGVFVPQMYALTKVYRHLPLVVDNLVTSCAALASIAKLFMIWYRRGVLHQIINNVTTDWLRRKPSWEREIMRRRAYPARLFTMSGYAVICGCLLGYLLTPIFGLSIRAINNITDHGERYFPLQTSYPYAAELSPYFELTYASQLIASGSIGFAMCIPENFFGALVFHASAQLEILAGKFAEAACSEDPRRLRLRMPNLVQTHVALIRFVRDVEASFNVLVLSHVVCLTVIVACIAYSVISSLENEGESLQVIQVLTPALSITTLMTHMFVFCFASEMLSNNSCKLGEAVYQTNVCLLSSEYARDLMIIMIRSQWPLQLTAGKFFGLSMNFYLQFVKNTGAYVSMLMAVNG